MLLYRDGLDASLWPTARTISHWQAASGRESSSPREWRCRLVGFFYSWPGAAGAIPRVSGQLREESGGLCRLQSRLAKVHVMATGHVPLPPGTCSPAKIPSCPRGLLARIYFEMAFIICLRAKDPLPFVPIRTLWLLCFSIFCFIQSFLFLFSDHPAPKSITA
jgi:hypothetical protein